MRKKKLLLMGTLLFMGWCTIQLYLFVHKPQSQRLKSAFPWFIRSGYVNNTGDNDDNSINNIDHSSSSSSLSFLSSSSSSSSSSTFSQNNKSGGGGANSEKIIITDNNHNHSANNNVIFSVDGRKKVKNFTTPANTTTTITDHHSHNNEQTEIADKFTIKSKTKIIDFDDISRKIETLEHDLNQQTKSTEVMLRLLKTIGKLAEMMNKTIYEVINDKTLLNSLMIDQSSNKKPIICVLLFACNRITIKRNLEQLFKYRNDSEIFPIVVSQDCNHEPTREIIESYGDRLTFIQQPDQSDIILKGKNQKKFKGYYKISRHYGWALNYTFNTLNYDTVLIVEDDLDIAPDFFEYFLALYPILRSDPSLYCISAWNDNGKSSLIEEDSTKLFRSDFFPGLGWMLTKNLWLEFQHKWPKAFWDDWIREPEQRRNRACIRPEISRTRTFGKKGVSNGLFFEKHLKFIQLNEEFVPFTKMNLSYLLKENYDVEFLKQVYNSRLISLYDIKSLPILYDNDLIQKQRPSINGHDNSNVNGNNGTATTRSPIASKYSVRIQYETRDQFKKAAKMFGLMDDFKSGVPRTGYQGTVGFIYRGYRVYLAPSPIWNGYNITWK
ncbi:alpha-1,3-mannosyl-glycoprotein 2-beta-N-acetylglucosaminyltransferase [Dermatophagoides farinae]|uniref:alpha-1,3-mannosyl-glycoprotein 2-beta-N-acetylglucosaminyltransferase n=1 Tax=Dermatophagoides farinae TaxID=6954 RepID=UPI003F64254D